MLSEVLVKAKMFKGKNGRHLIRNDVNTGHYVGVRGRKAFENAWEPRHSMLSGEKVTPGHPGPFPFWVNAGD